jgi:enoyl-CoA hydratase
VAFVSLEVSDGVGTIRLDRPPMNALDARISAELLQVAREAATNAEVRSLVIWGGPKVFAAGADVKAMAPMGHSEIAGYLADLTGALEAVARLPKPTVAAVTGYALGGGLELALCADFRVLADDAKVGVPEILLGVIPGAGGTQRLPRLIGPARAKDLIFSGRQVRADEALALGLADQVVPAESTYDEAVRLARRFADGPAQALAAAKRAVDDGGTLPLTEGLRLESALFVGLFGTEDRRIGMDSFLESGPGKAKFVGR